jgi:Predicted metal-sulfur cluster biosynthetic enzyme
MSEIAAIPTPETLMEKLSEVIDPELGISIVDLGLVYDVTFDDGDVLVTMTLTSPGCPLGPVIRGEAYASSRSARA